MTGSIWRRSVCMRLRPVWIPCAAVGCARSPTISPPWKRSSRPASRRNDMPVFTYEVMERGGTIKTGEREATAAEALQTNLAREGLFVIKIRRKGGLAWLGGGGGSGRSQALHDALAGLTARVKITDLVLFTGQLAAMIEAGLHLLRSLTSLAEETLNKYFKGVIEHVGADVAQGQSLAEAMGKHPRAFNSFYVSLIRVGESSGRLPQVLNQLATYLEKTAQLRRKILGALS